MPRRVAAAVVGVISDTHGWLRPEAIAALQGCTAILHAGDIGKPQVLDGLRALAPVTAVRGNVDLQWAEHLPETSELTVAGKRFYVVHDLKQSRIDPRTAGIDIVIAGHSHWPRIERRDEVLHVNPGSAGPRRFKLPVTVARIEIAAEAVEARIILLVD